MWNWVKPSGVVMVALLAGWSLGCQRSVTERDVSDAEEDVREEQRETQETRREARQEVAEEAREAREGRGYRGDRAAEGWRDVQETRQEGAQRIEEEQRETEEARREARETRKEFSSEQNRDQYVSRIEGRMQAADQTLERLKQQADDAEGARETELQRRIDEIKSYRDQVDDKLGDLKSADPNAWQQHRASVDEVLQKMENAIKAQPTP